LPPRAADTAGTNAAPPMSAPARMNAPTFMFMLPSFVGMLYPAQQHVPCHRLPDEACRAMIDDPSADNGRQIP
jgi:hypothetical protein